MDKVIYVCKYVKLYSNFKNYVKSYFGFDDEFAIDMNNNFDGAYFDCGSINHIETYNIFKMIFI